MDRSKEYFRLGKQISYVILAEALIILVGIIELPILTKGIGVNSYGIWSLINVTISLITPFALIVFDVSIIRFLAAFTEDKKKVQKEFYSAFLIVFIMGTFFSLLLFLLASPLARYIIQDITASVYIRIVSVLILLNAINSLFLAFFRMRREIGVYTILNLSLYVLKLIAIAVVTYLGFQLKGVLIAVILSEIIIIILKGWNILRRIGFYIPRHLYNMKKYLKWGIPLTPNLAILWIIHTSNRYILSGFHGVAITGIYSAAYRIADFAKFILLPLGTVLYPTIVKLYDKGKLEETKNYFKYSLKYFMMISIPSCFGLSILSKPLLELFTTPEFLSGYIVIPLISAGAVVFGFYQICLYIIHLVGKTKITIRLLSTAAFINIVLSLILIPRIGMLGAGIAALVSYIVLGLLTLIITRRYFKFDIDIMFVVKSIISSIIMSPFIWLIRPSSIISITISIFVGALIYFCALYLLKGFSRKEISFFQKFIKENFKNNFINTYINSR